MTPRSKPLLLVISQVYVPDPASVGQHLADAAEAIAAREYRVLVLTSARGYENPETKYPRREQRSGVEILRLPLSSFGKTSLLLRLLGQILFVCQATIRGLFCRRLAGVLVSTSPPMASFAALLISFVRGTPITYWLMDLNPDQVLALGNATARNPLVVALKWLNRRIFARAREIVVLDQYMASRIQQHYRVGRRITVLPPWPHEGSLGECPHSDNPFRAEHGLNERLVVMYSGNHSPASPVTTLISAALRLKDDPRFIFVFVGGGLGKKEVDITIAAHRPPNIISLPYQPLERIKFSLSAADLHVVTLGNDMPGIIHPCKIYGALAVGRPILLIGPRRSHAGDLIERHDVGWRVEQGDVAGTIDLLEHFATMPPAARTDLGRRARSVIVAEYSKTRLSAAFCDVVERSMTAGYFRRHEPRFDVGRGLDVTVKESA